VAYDYDLIEEVARIYGYHNLPTHLPCGQIPIQPKDRIFYWEEIVKNVLAGLGLTEVYNYSMTSQRILNRAGFGQAELLKIANPLNEEMMAMRPTLMAGILQNIADNLNNFSSLRIFELGNIYLPKGSKELPEELLKLTGAILMQDQDCFFQAKGVVELLLKKLGINRFEFKLTDQNCPLWQKQAALDVFVNQKYVGQFGLVNNKLLESFGINKPAAVFDFDFLALVHLATAVKTFSPIPEFPNITRDLAIIINHDLAWGKIRNLVKKVDRLIVDVDYLSIFTAKDLPADKKSLAFRVTFRALDRTLKSEEADAIIEKIINRLKNEFQAQLR
jgi:phenylalanyl-tRNA synthetase beta chain